MTHKKMRLSAAFAALALMLCLASCRDYAYGTESRYGINIDETPPEEITVTAPRDTEGQHSSSDITRPPTGTQGDAQSGTQNGTQSGSVSDGTGESGGSPSVDYAELINTVSTKTIKACVNITMREYTTNIFGMETAYQTSLGSGVIICEEVGEGDIYGYYILTNYHVIEPSGNYQHVRYTVADYQGNTYNASIIPTKAENAEALCASYDLAVLGFTCETRLEVAALSDKDPETGSLVVSIGQPHGQHNALTLGTCVGYDNITLSDGTSTVFKALCHTAPIDHGNSGGAIFDKEHMLVGINFAGSWDADGEFAYGYGIPAESVRTFLSEYGFKLI